MAAPPQAVDPTKQTLLYALFPVVGSLGLFAFAIVYDNKLFIYVACAMVAITLLFAVGMRWSQKRSGKKTARRQRKRYREYLGGEEETLRELAAAQRRAAEHLYPDPHQLWAATLGRDRLWERRRDHSDFLRLRVGRGSLPHIARPRVDLGNNPLAEYEQGLVDEAEDLARGLEMVEEIPVTLSLESSPVASIVGPPEAARGLARSLLVQLAVGRGPDELLLAVSHRPGEDESWDWLKWLPHARWSADDDAPAQIGLTGSVAGLDEILSTHLAPRLEQLRKLRAANAGSEGLNVPRLVLVLDSFTPEDERVHLPLLREAMNAGSELSVSVICLVERSAAEPAEAGTRVRVLDQGPASVEQTGPGGEVAKVDQPDELGLDAAETVARALAPIRLVESSHGASRRRGGGLLDLHGISSIDQIESENGWPARPRELELRSILGTASDGDPLVLDLKQQAEGGMGPHGLIIGATGSGKSELLRTLVTSLALTHSPERLNFVFVDFKGGAALADFETLPHTAGMITNLEGDEALVGRMHDALYGEQKRREQILRDAGNVDDVIAYRELCERDPGLEPLPDLLVIIDEFSELLANHPDFIDLFVAIGRVGRSLGIHLLFSSQRFEEGKLRGLESHLRYRICLRTYSPAESKAVLGTPDAFVLPPDPGLGFLRVDATTYTPFRAALSTRPYRPPTRSRPKSTVTPFEAEAAKRPSGRGRDRDRASERGADADTEMGLVLDRLRGRGAAGAHQVWLPPLEAEMPLDAVDARRPWWKGASQPAGELSATVGAIDLPTEQKQGPLSLDLAGPAGHLAIVGAPQSGKSNFLRSLILDLARAYEPDRLQAYCVDLGGGLLGACAGLPHVGAVARSGEPDLVAQVIGRARAEIEARQAAFRRLGIDSMAQARSGARGESFADVLVVIDGWAQLRRDFEDLEPEVEEVASTGLSYGIHLAIGAQRWAEIRPSISDNIGTRVELRLNEPMESTIGRRHAERVPAETPGRGLVEPGVEFQAALPRLDGKTTSEAIGETLVATADAIAKRWDGAPAPAVRVLPAKVTATDAPAHSPGSGVPIGVDAAMEPVGIQFDGADPHFLVLGDGESGRTNLLRAIAHGVASSSTPDEAQLLVVDPRRTLGDLAALPNLSGYASTGPAVAELAAKVVADVTERLERLETEADGWDGPRLVLLIDDYDLLAGPEGNPLDARSRACSPTGATPGSTSCWHAGLPVPPAGRSRASTSASPSCARRGSC